MSRHFWRACNREAGFSFVELLVTIIIAGIAFAAIVPMFVQAQQAGSGDRARMVALNVAQDRVEKIRQLDYDLITSANLASTTNSATWLYSAEFGPTWTTSGGRDYSVGYQVEELKDDSDQDLYKSVTVRVTWAQGPDSIDGTDAVTLRTFVYKQYAGPQIVDLYLASPVGSAVDTSTSPYVITWDSGSMGLLTVKLDAILNPADDNSLVRYVSFTGYGAGSVPVVSENVSTRTGTPPRFSVSWSPATDGTEDGLYRFEATAYSKEGGYAGNTFVEELRLETGPPPAPSGFVVTTAETSVTLVWASSPAADVVSYEVYRWVDGQDPVRIDDGTVTSAFYKDTGLTTLTPYHYYVVAVDASGNLSAHSATINATPHASADLTAPPAPVVTSIPTFRKAVLSWTDVVDPVVGTDPTSGISYYLIRRSDGAEYWQPSPKFPGQVVQWSQDISADFSYTVASVDVDGNESAPSPSVSVPYTVPTHKMILSSNKNCDFTVTDSTGTVVGSKNNSKSYELTLDEGTYQVKAVRNAVTRGPIPVELDQDPEVVPAFSF